MEIPINMRVKPTSSVIVPDTGHTWKSGKLRASQEGKAQKSYDPFKEQPALFIEFLKLAPTQESILEFANSYGNLDRASLKSWKHEIKLLDLAWNAAQECINRTKLQNSISQTLASHGLLESYFDKKSKLKDSHQLRQIKHATGSQRDSVGKIAEHVLTSRGKISVTIDESGKPTVGLHFQGLADALWGQWMLAVCENQKFQDCEQCGKPIPLSLKVTRLEQKFCSNLCQMKAYRRRQKQAREMRAGGKHLRDIARELESKVSTVKKWVGE